MYMGMKPGMSGPMGPGVSKLFMYDSYTFVKCASVHINL